MVKTDCDEVLANMRARRQRLLRDINQAERRQAPFEEQRALLQEHQELQAGERAMIDYRRAHEHKLSRA